MSSFSVIVTNIRGLYPIEGADRIECASVTDNEYRFVVAKGSVTVGQQVLYIPLDAIIPDEVLDKVGLKGKLGGHAKNRVKTIKLKGQISQGLVVSPATVGIDLHAVISKFASPEHQGEEITKLLGIVKYDEEVRQSGGPNGAGSVNLHPRKATISKFDVENWEAHKRTVTMLIDENEPVYISEKAEGSAGYLELEMLPDTKDEHGVVDTTKAAVMTLCSRNCYVPWVTEGKSWWQQAAENSGLLETIHRIAAATKFPKNLLIRYEAVGPGIQKNIYKLDKIVGLLYDIEVNQVPVTPKEFLELTLPSERVPTVFIGQLKDYLGDKQLSELCNGKTVIGNNPEQLREGIVIRPLNRNINIRGMGVCKLKARSPVYLAGSDL